LLSGRLMYCKDPARANNFLFSPGYFQKRLNTKEEVKNEADTESHTNDYSGFTCYCSGQRFLRRNFMARNLLYYFPPQHLIRLSLPGNLVWPVALCTPISHSQWLPGWSSFPGFIRRYPGFDVGLVSLGNEIDPLDDNCPYYFS